MAENTHGVMAGASTQPSDRERMAAAMEALEDNDPQAAFVILKTALASGVTVGGHQTFSQQTPTAPEDGKA